MPTTIIAGAGHAGGQTAISLRQAGYEGRIVVCGDEPVPPYQRPPLSKKYLCGELALERVLLRPENFYATHDIELRLGSAVREFAPERRSVVLDGGESLDYTDLVIATGSRPRRLEVPGSDLGNIFYLRTLEDADAIGKELVAGRRLVVVGGGYIGLEIASTAKGLGMKVCVVEAADRILGRVTAPEMSAYYTHAHRARGVDVRLSTGIVSFEGDGMVRGVVCADETIPADVVAIGVGITPNEGLAASAGIPCDGGILVDERCAAAEHVYAVGDCTRHPNRILGRRLRLESVQNALEQARTAAANIAGTPAKYEQIPWFWSDQFDLKLQMVGMSQGYDTIVQRGSMDADDFAMFYLKEGMLIAADAVNRPREFMACRQLVPQRPSIDPVKLADESIPMKEMV
ncbi:MAG: FAD-dependent oxidoreductase [Thiotrichales bacterium]|nr:FAD-dependent oxidoreductase [Thiotrichales bacterium]